MYTKEGASGRTCCDPGRCRVGELLMIQEVLRTTLGPLSVLRTGAHALTRVSRLDHLGEREDRVDDLHGPARDLLRRHLRRGECVWDRNLFLGVGRRLLVRRQTLYAWGSASTHQAAVSGLSARTARENVQLLQRDVVERKRRRSRISA
jgi:hypothetical protein